MKIDNLRMFCLVVEEGSISKAARLGFVSQPAVTRQIRQLENHYGALLFDRDDGKLRLTKEGEVLYPYIKEIIDLDKISYNTIQEVLGKQKTVLNVGASLTIGEYLLPGLLGRFNVQHPDIRFNLSIGNTPNIISKLEENDIDIALVESSVNDSSFSMEKFADDELILISAWNHHWKDSKEIDFIALTKEKMIWREKDSGTRLIVENSLREHGVLHKIEHTMELGSMQAIKSAVEANLGISILPKLTVQKELKYNILREVPINNFNLLRDLWIVQKSRRFKKRAQSYFEEFLLR